MRTLVPAMFLRPAVPIGFALLAAACTGAGDQGPPPARPAPVTVAKVLAKTVPVEVRGVGTVEAYAQVEVRSLVGGELTRVHFARGQTVRRGALMFSIDPSPYQADLDEALARLERDRAIAKTAVQEVDRYDDLVEKEYVTREKYDQIVADAAAAQATVQADEAAAESARLRLGYCSIRAPITGRVGDVLVHAGNLVKANDDDPMAIVLQTQPILVAFSVPERHLSEVRRRAAGAALDVLARPAAGGAESRGELVFIDNAVNTATGTILLKARFSNQGEALWPGQFVDVVLVLSQEHDVPVVPSEALQRGQRGTYVFVVKNDDTVESRPVETGREHDGDTVIVSGLDTGEVVVTEGQLRLVPGARIEVRTAAP